MSALEYKIQKNTLTLDLSGDFVHFEDTGGLYRDAALANVKKIEVRGQGIKSWDSSLLVILFELNRIAEHQQSAFEAQGLPEGLQKMLDLSLAVKPLPDANQTLRESRLEALGGWGLDVYQSAIKGLKFAADNLKSLFKFMFGSTATRKVDFLFALQDCGPNAVAIVSLISFMVGLILAFVGAIQLKTFGAQIYVASLVTVGMIRIMGAIMCGIIMAGRTGASFAATLGTMQVNEEIDALKTMGISVNEFLVLPRLAALILVMPLLTMWSDFMGMLGGGFVGVMVLDIPAGEYWKYSWQAWSMQNFWVGIFHGFVFGFIIALCGCYYGINSGRNADGVGVATTKAVVSAIVWMIVATGILTIIFERLGI